VTEDRLAAGLRQFSDTTLPSAAWWEPFVDVLEVDGASVATVGPVLGSETLSASDFQAARLDELQFDLGEGPCWDAMTSGHAVVEPDIRGRPSTTWPAFSPALDKEDVGALIVFPLRIGPLQLGAVDLYCHEATPFDASTRDRGSQLAVAASRLVFKRAMEEGAADPEDLAVPRFSRRTVHQATGMVLAQLQISADDAHLLIQGQAFASGRTMADVATDIVERRLRFSSTGEGIQEHR
jgi:hypothetical protein